MTVLKSHIDTSTEEFQANTDHMAGLVADLKERLARVAEGGGEATALAIELND